MNEDNNKTIRFSKTTDQKLEKLSQKFGRNKLLLFNQMVDYFHKTSKDPSDISDELLKKMLAKSHDTYTSFIKAQEKILLIPMRQDVSRMISNQEQIVKYFND
jgi:C-terminal processing protease CtpA/Prc